MTTPAPLDTFGTAVAELRVAQEQLAKAKTNHDRLTAQVQREREPWPKRSAPTTVRSKRA